MAEGGLKLHVAASLPQIMSIFGTRCRGILAAVIVWSGTLPAAAQSRVVVEAAVVNNGLPRSIDAGARARLSEWHALVAANHRSDATKVQAVQEFFSRFAQQDDATTWGKADYWTSLGELLTVGAGDCEDFAIAKYLTLIAMGVAPSRMTLTIARSFLPGPRRIERHMVLIYRDPTGPRQWVIDNVRAAIVGLDERPDLTVTGEVIVGPDTLDAARSLASGLIDIRIQPVAMQTVAPGARRDKE